MILTLKRKVYAILIKTGTIYSTYKKEEEKKDSRSHVIISMLALIIIQPQKVTL